MKNQILKHTGLSEKEFYKKYPTTDDFFNSKEGKAFKKAQGGGTFGFKQPGIPQTDYEPLPNVQGMLPSTNIQAQPFQSPAPQSSMNFGDANKNQVPDYLEGASSAPQVVGPQNEVKPYYETGKKAGFDPTSLIGPATDTIGAITSFLDEKKQAKEAKMWHGVTDVQLKASKTRPEQYDRKYVRPEDQQMTGEEFFPIYGVGTNPIAQSGSMIGGNPTEIQNTYNPYDLYEDLGYEPLNDSNVKQYQSGGFMDFLGAASNPANSAVSSLYDNNAGYQAGNTLGQAAKFIPGIGPVLSSVASPILGAIGGQLDKTFGNAGKIARYQKATDRNVSQMQGSQMAASVQAGLASHLEHGGNVQPQVLKYFGEHAVADLFKPDPMMNTLQDGGELQTHWGGYAEPISQNPYLPDGGQTVMFRGQSHRDTDGRGNSGIGVTYGNNPVEVEGGEPAMKLQDGSGDPNMVVFGNLPINKNNAGLLGDPKATNKRFKNYVADLSKQEAKHTKTLDKNTIALDELEVYDPFDKLTFASHQANMMGSNMNLKNIAEKKQKAAFLQNAINETRDELSDKLGYTVSAEQLAKNGEITKDKDPVTKMAKWGAAIDKYADGSKPRKFKSDAEAITAGFKKNNKGVYVKAGTQGTTKITKQEKAAALEYIPKGQHKQASGVWGKVTPEQVDQLKSNNPWYDWTGFDPNKKNDVLKFQQEFNNKAISIGSPARIHQDDALGEQTATARLDLQQTADTPVSEEIGVVETPVEMVEKKPNWWNLLGAALPYIRPSNAGHLDPNQLMGEMNALANNQVEPVQAQSYQPQLDVPYDISLQDQLNQVTAQTRAAQRMAGYNPAAQAAIAGQAYEPANRILGEQFRLNQAKKDQVYSGNRATMNDARLKNLGIYDQQAQRLSQAVSNTKQVQQAALSSISDKYQRNALENKQLQTYENLYNYRYGPGMRAYNVNAPAQFNVPTVYDESEDYTSVPNAVPIYDKKGKVKGYQQQDIIQDDAVVKKTKATVRNGSIMKSLKRM